MTKKGPYRVQHGQPSPESLGSRVAQIRKAWGWTQGELASQLRIRAASVSAWERGVAEPNGISLIALASVLNTTPEALLGEAPFSVPPMLEGVAEPGGRSYCLPRSSEKGRVLLVSEGTVSRSLISSQLKKVVDEALSKDKAVWLVIE